MNHHPIRFDPLAFSEEWRAVQGLARRLAGDAGDDLAQDAWLAALERPPEASWHLRGWLRGVVINLAKERRREQTRRAARERRAAGRMPARSATGDTVERLEVHRIVVDAVLRLAPPSRDVIVLRFFDGLPPRAIADRLGLPVETVKTRLKRAIHRLREDLGDRPDSKAVFRSLSLLVGLAPVHRPLSLELLAALLRKPLAHMASAGALAMKSKALTLTAVLALLLIGGISIVTSPWEWRDDGDDPGERPLRSAPHVAAADPVEPLTTVAFKPPMAEEPQGAMPLAHLRGQVVDPKGEPVPGAAVLLHAQTGSLQQASWSVGLELIEVWRRAPPAQGKAVTDSNGAFALEARADSRVVLTASAPGHGPGCLTDVDATGALDGLVIRLLPAGVVSGVITNDRGEPIEGALVRVLSGGPLRGYERQATSGADGRFSVDGLPLGTGHLWVTADGYLDHLHAEITIPMEEQRVVLERGRRLAGRVVWADDGQPVAGAEVVVARNGMDGEPGFTTTRDRTNSEGHFQLTVPAGSLQSCVCQVLLDGLALLSGPAPDGEAAQPIELRLERPRTVTIRTFERKEDGEKIPVPAVELEIHGPAQGTARIVRTCSDAEGVARARIAAHATCMVRAAPGADFEIVPNGGFAGVTLAPDTDSAEVIVWRLASISGQVLTSDGKPATEARVVFGWAKFPVPSMSFGASATDPEGRFVIRGVPPGDYEGGVHATLPGGGAGASEPFLVPPGGRVDDIIVTLGPPLSITGRIVGASGEPLENVQVRAVPTRLWQTAQSGGVLANSEAPPAHSDQDGRFRIEGLLAEPYSVFAWKPGLRAMERHDVPPSVEGTSLSEIVLEPVIAFRGRVVDEAGRPIGDASVHLIIDGGPTVNGRSRSDGTFAFATSADGRWLLGSRGSPQWGPMCLQPGKGRCLASAPGYLPTRQIAVELPQATPLEVVLSPGECIAGRVLDRSGQPAAGVEVIARIDDRETGFAPGEAATSKTDADGRFEIQRLKRGAFRVVAFRREGGAVFLPAAEVPTGTRDLLLREYDGVTLEGVVVDQRGRSLAGIQVRAKGRLDANARMAETDTRGRFRFTGMEPKAYAMWTDDLDFAGAPLEGVVPGVTDLEIWLAPALEITGRAVHAEDGKPIQAEIGAQRMDGGGPIRRGTTDANGRFQITGLAEGLYRLWAAPSRGGSMTLENLPAGTQDVTFEF